MFLPWFTWDYTKVFVVLFILALIINIFEHIHMLRQQYNEPQKKHQKTLSIPLKNIWLSNINLNKWPPGGAHLVYLMGHGDSHSDALESKEREG